MCNRRGPNSKANKPKPRKRAVMKAVQPKPKKCLPGYDDDGSGWDDDEGDLTEFDKAPEDS